MKHRFISAAWIASVLLLSASSAFASENHGDAADASGQSVASTKSTPASRAEIAARRKAAAKVKLVDINSAKKEQLKKLPGVSDAEADSIIAGRPYGSKAWLVGKKIIPEGVYDGIKGLIIAKQPFKDAAQNAAVYSKKP